MEPTPGNLTPRLVRHPIYFPPPPTQVGSESDGKKGIKINFSKPRPQADTSSLTSNSSQEPLKPVLKRRKLTTIKRQRQWILVGLLVLSFTILILSVIFAYCAALPHSENLHTDHGNSPSQSTTATPTAVNIAAATSTSSYGSRRSLLRRDDYTTMEDSTNDVTVNRALEIDRNHTIEFTRPAAMASLTFYTATLPMLTIIHTSIELLTSLVRPQTTQATKLGDLLRFRSVHSTRPNSRPMWKITGTRLSFLASILLCVGWIIIQGLWINCEIVSSNLSDGVCPVQIRGHSMAGVSELSGVKVALGFIVVAGYAGYALYLVQRAQCFNRTTALADAETGRFSGDCRSQRVVSFRPMRKVTEDDAEMVVIRMDVEKK